MNPESIVQVELTSAVGMRTAIATQISPNNVTRTTLDDISPFADIVSTELLK